MLSRVSASYKVTGPAPVNGVEPGGIVKHEDLTDPDILIQIGFITLVETTSKTMSKSADSETGSSTMLVPDSSVSDESSTSITGA